MRPELLRGAHRRYNPLLDEWVLCSPQRLERPWQGHVESISAAAPPAHDPGCYLCPGNRRSGGARNPEYQTTFAFDNDFPALTPAPTGAARADHEDLLIAEQAGGRCRVLCVTPRHDLSLATMSAAQVRSVVDAWIDETTLLAREPGAAYVQLFENRGELMGCSNPHPHAQLWMTTHVPTLPARKRDRQRRYFASTGRDLLGDYLDRERRAGERIVLANDDWTVLVPFWAVWPFQTMLIPSRPASSLPALDARQRDGLAAIVRELAARYDTLFGCEFPYSMGWCPAPVGDETDPAWRLHAEFLPPLLRSASVRKFFVGYELLAEAQRDLTSESAAERLRSVVVPRDG